jgi:hypothetical protein
MTGSSWPSRDPFNPDGVRWDSPRPAGRARLVRHDHVCPDGTAVTCFSQHITVTGVTLDRWFVDEYPIAVSLRTTAAEAPPDFGWVDTRSRLAS